MIDNIIDINEKLIGNIEFHDETNADNESFQNLNTVGDLMIHYVRELNELIQLENDGRHSAKMLATKAKSILCDINEYVHEIDFN